MSTQLADFERWRAEQHRPTVTAWMIWLGALGLQCDSPAGRAGRPAFDAWLDTVRGADDWTEFDVWRVALRWRAEKLNQCDGCMSGARYDNGGHYDDQGKLYMMCQQHRYQPPPGGVEGSNGPGDCQSCEGGKCTTGPRCVTLGRD